MSIQYIYIYTCVCMSPLAPTETGHPEDPGNGQEHAKGSLNRELVPLRTSAPFDNTSKAALYLDGPSIHISDT